MVLSEKGQTDKKTHKRTIDHTNLPDTEPKHGPHADTAYQVVRVRVCRLLAVFLDKVPAASVSCQHNLFPKPVGGIQSCSARQSVPHTTNENRNADGLLGGQASTLLWSVAMAEVPCPFHRCFGYTAPALKDLGYKGSASYDATLMRGIR